MRSCKLFLLLDKGIFYPNSKFNDNLLRISPENNTFIQVMLIGVCIACESLACTLSTLKEIMNCNANMQAISTKLCIYLEYVLVNGNMLFVCMHFKDLWCYNHISHAHVCTRFVGTPYYRPILKCRTAQNTELRTQNNARTPNASGGSLSCLWHLFLIIIEKSGNLNHWWCGYRLKTTINVCMRVHTSTYVSVCRCMLCALVCGSIWTWPDT